MKPQPNPQTAEEARRLIHSLLRENCPHGFQSEQDRARARVLSPRSQALIRRAGAAFPQALGAFDIDGRNALHWAARYDAPQLVQFMLDSGVDPLERQLSHALPLAEAASLNHGPALEILIQASGVDARGPAPPGFTALMEASYCGNRPAIEQLLAHGANPSLASANGDTPLHLLCLGKKDEARALACFALLLDAGSPLAALNRKGQTPLAVAREHHNPLAAALEALLERQVLDGASGPARAVKGPSL